MISGFLNVDKPAGITSHDVIFKLRRSTKIKRMGHTGTLDPDVTGVLPIAIGSACRLIDYLPQGKVYLAQILLGLRTTTDDLSGTVIERKDLDVAIDRKMIEAALKAFVGTIKQIPPIYSAVHHEGQRLHYLARRKSFEATPERMAEILSTVKERSVYIDRIDLLAVQLPIITLRITCAPGTYIRSLSRDLGKALGCGACLQSLRREKSGPFEVAQSYELETLQELIKGAKLSNALISPEKMLGLKKIELDMSAAILISQGKYLHIDTLADSEKQNFLADELVFALCRQVISTPQIAVPIAIVKICEDGLIKPKVGLIHPDQLRF